MASIAQQQIGSVDAALAHAARLADVSPELALRQVEELLAVVPRHPQALLIAGRAHRIAGRPGEARRLLAALARAEPRSAATAFELGLSAWALGDGATAIASLRRAVMLKPDLAEAWSALADALRLAGEDVEADRAYLAGVRAATRDPVLLRAALALSEGRLAEAEPVLRARLRERPTDVAAIRMLAEVASRLGRYQDADRLLTRALELAPGFHAARELLARNLQRQNRPAEALEQVARLLAADPANPSWAMLRASTLVRIGDQEGARAVYEEVLARYPQQPKAWMSLGHVLKTIGLQDDGVAAYREAIARRPSLGEAWWSLANLKTFRFTPEDVATMTSALAGTADEDDRLHLHFALGKALEDAGEDEAAFAQYAHGNRIRHAQLRYDADEITAQCARAAALLTPGFFAARAGSGCPAPDPIFILGLPRAGSTLVEQILSSHSMVEGTMELPDMMAIASRLAERGQRGVPGRSIDVLAALSADELRALGEEYLERTRIQRHSDKPYFTDKMPNNWAHVGLIQLILPNARIIDARRHPVGCCLSAYKQHFSRGQAFSYDLGDLGRYYRDYVGAMAHVDGVLPGRVHRVIYESMVADTKGEVRRLLDHLGLPFEDGCLAFHRNDRAVRTASSEQVRRPIFADAIDHWRRFAPMLGPLVAALGPVLDAYPQAPADIFDSGQQSRVARGTDEREQARV